MSWNRWLARAFGGLLTLAAGGGCKQQLFTDAADYHDAVKYNLPPRLDTNVHDAILPAVLDRNGPGPATVLDPDRPARNITLKECLALALEQGNIGSQNPNGFGNKNDGINGFNGNNNSGGDSVRAFALEPAFNGARIERALAKFDARWSTSMAWQKVDQPVAAQFLQFQQQRDGASFATRIDKPLPSGGLANITFSTDYSKFASTGGQAGFTNPNYTPRLSFGFEQPLWRFFGVEVNQLLDFHPNFFPGSSQAGSGFAFNQPQTNGDVPGGGGILVTRIKADQAQTAFEAQMNFMLANVETAYWNLYSAYYNLFAQQEGLLQTFDGWRFTKARVDLGSDPAPGLYQYQAQFERFRGQVYRARAQVLDAERQLRGLLGLRSDDGTRLVPIDEPNLAPYKPDFYEAANDAITYRPELMSARQELKITQLQLQLARETRRPDVRFISSYDVAGLGTRLDGPEFTGTNQTTQGNALTSFRNNQFNSWNLALKMDIPLGFREQNAAIRQAQIRLTGNYYHLRDAELRAVEFVTLHARRVVDTHVQIGTFRAERVQLQEYVKGIKATIEIGRYNSNEYLNHLQAQRDLAVAISSEFQAIGSYNAALAQLEYAKGTILRYNNITIGDGPLPAHVSKRAADHIRERTDAALELRQRPAVMGGGTMPNHQVGPATGSPYIDATAPLTEKRPSVPDRLPDMTPDAKPADPKKGQQLPPPSALPDKSAGRGFPATATGNSRGPAAQPLPTPTPLPTGGAAGTDQEFFRPEGTVTVPRTRPFGPVSTGGVPPGRATDVPPIGGGTGVPPIPRP